MMTKNISSEILEMVCAALENPSQKTLDEIRNKLNLLDQERLVSVIPEIELLLDSWNDAVEKNAEMAEFAMQVAEIDAFANSSSLRDSLVLAARKYCPDFLTKSESVRLSAARELLFPLKKISERIRKLSLLGGNRFCAYLLHSNEWVQKKDFDSITHSVKLFDFIKQNEKRVSAEVFIGDSLFFLLTPDDILRSLSKDFSITFPDWADFLKRNALFPPNPEQIRLISLNTFVPRKMNSSEFSAWINPEDLSQNKSRKTALKHPADARGLAEIKAIVAELKKTRSKIKFTGENAQSIRQVLFKTETTLFSNDFIIDSFELFSGLFDLSEDEQSTKNLLPPFSDFLQKVSFDKIKYDLFLSWDNSSSTTLAKLLSALKDCKGEQFLAKIALEMPIKALAALSGTIDGMQIIISYKNSRIKPTADLILWGWKNRKNAEIVETLINPEAVFAALADKTELRYRKNSLRELKKNLLADDDFISTLAKYAMKNSPLLLINSIDEDHVLLPAEKQSFFVKLSRVSQSFKTAIEEAHGSGGIKLSKTLSDNSKELDQIVTSIKSHREKILELEDITQKQMPENSQAIAHARSYGDLRENAEFSAAKDRQKFLRRRKLEIERELNQVAAVRFTANDGDEQSIKSGRELKLRNTESNNMIKYYLLGAWDGAPDKGRLSSEAKLGKILIGKKQGDKINFDGAEFQIEKVSYLPDDLIRELNDEQ